MFLHHLFKNPLILLIKEILKSYKGYLFSVNSTMLLATVCELLAYSIAISYFSQSWPEFLTPHIDQLNNNPNTLIYLCCIFILFLFLSSVLYYCSALMSASCRVKAFKRNIDSMLSMVIRAPESDFVCKNLGSDLPRALRRDCRYLSLSLTDLITLPKLLLIIIFISTYGLLNYPIVSSVFIGLSVALIPIYVYVSKYGRRGMDGLLSSGAKKSNADKSIVKFILSQPVMLTSNDYKVFDQHHIYVNSFLSNYKRRMILAPLSDLVSRLCAVLIFSIIGCFLILGYQQGKFNFSDIIVIIIGLRFLVQALMELGQKCVIILSYVPLMGGLAHFILGGGRTEKRNAIEQHVPSTGLSQHFCTIGNSELNWIVSNLVANHMSYDNSETILITDTQISNELLSKLPSIEHILSHQLSDLSSSFKDDLRVVNIEKSGPSFAVSFFTIISLTVNSKPCNIIIDGKLFNQLSASDKGVLLEYFGKYSICVYYSSIPKRKPSPFEERVYELRDGNLISIADDNIYNKKLSEQRARKSNKSQVLSDEDYGELL